MAATKRPASRAKTKKKPAGSARSGIVVFRPARRAIGQMSRRTKILFILLFAIIGTALLHFSFASTPDLTDMVVGEVDVQPEALSTDSTGASHFSSQEIVFQVTSTNMLVCGDKSTPDTLNTVQLSDQQVSDLANQVIAAGINTMPAEVNSPGQAHTGRYTLVTVNTNGVDKQVAIYGNANANSFGQAVRKIGQSICKQTRNQAPRNDMTATNGKSTQAALSASAGQKLAQQIENELTPKAYATTGSYAPNAEAASYKYTNDYRAQYKLAALTPATCMMNRARQWSAHMASVNTLYHDPQVFSNTDPTSLFTQCNVVNTRTWAGENIGWTSCLTNQCVADLVAAMANEQAPNDGHRLNIISPNYKYSGVGVYYDTTNHKMWVTQDFLNCSVANCVSTYSPAYFPIWHDWFDMGQAISASPVVTSWGNGRYDMFTCDAGTVYHKYYQGGWSGWASLGGPCAGDDSIAATSRASGSLDVYSVGSDGHLHYRHFGGSWGAWQTYSGTFQGSVAVTTRGSNTLDLYATKSDGSVWHMYYNGSNWGNGWESLGGSGLRGISALYRSTSALDVYAIDASGNLVAQAYNATGWHGWSVIGSALSGGSTAAIATSADDLHVLASAAGSPYEDEFVAADGYEGVQSFVGGIFYGFNMTGTPTIGRWTGARMDAFARGTNGDIWQRIWY